MPFASFLRRYGNSMRTTGKYIGSRHATTDGNICQCMCVSAITRRVISSDHGIAIVHMVFDGRPTH
jgi:hypothetical protein